MAALIEVFDEACEHLVFNQDLATKFYRQQVGFVNKNSEHMEFFGGSLTGVQVVRWVDRDFNLFFDENLEIDVFLLKDGIKEVDDINMDHKVSSDAFNLTCTYLIHKFLTSQLMDPKRRERAAMDIALLFQYKCLCSILANSFRYPADPKLAQATYANLSYRFLIKKLGSWQEVLSFRAQEMISPEGLHRKALERFNDDLAIVYCINDSQGRLRDLIKNIYSEMMKAKNAGDRIYTTGGTMVDADGEEIFKDKANGLESYSNYVLGIATDRNSFIKTELVQIVVKMMHTMQPKGFARVLEWIPDALMKSGKSKTEELIVLTMQHSYNYLLSNGYSVRASKDITSILTKLKTIYISSRVTDADLLKMRELGSEIVTESIGKTNEQSVAAIRTGLFLYICLRAYTKQYYTSN